jgi:hypothetical protein
VKAQDIVHYRLYNQQVSVTKFKKPREIVAWFGAMQGQDYLGSLWAVGLRLPGSTEAAIEKALAAREILRTWPIRGTIHLVAAEDARWMADLMAPRIIKNAAYRRRQLELDDAVFEHSRKVLIPALEGDKQLSRQAAYMLLESAGITTAGQRGNHILWQLAQEGLLCMSTRQGKQPTYALLHEWAPAAKSLPRDESLARIALRYFTSHGPATIQDFMWWSGLVAADAKAGLGMVEKQLAKETILGKEYWLPQGLPSIIPGKNILHLLPPFDEYLVGYRDRSATLDKVNSGKVVPGNNGMFMPIIVINGQVVGTWKRIIKKDEVRVTPIPFTAWDKATGQLFTAAAARYSLFLGLSLS